VRNSQACSACADDAEVARKIQFSPRGRKVNDHGTLVPADWAHVCWKLVE